MKPDLAQVHPELQNTAKALPALPFSRQNLWFIRLMSKLLFFRRTPPDIQVENILIPAPEDNHKIRLRVYRAKTHTQLTPVLLWLHGGGYLIGNPEQDDLNCFTYVREAGVTVVSVDYRYAPEHPFPMGLEDSYTALQWLNTNAAQLKIDPTRLALGGASAGGGLAAGLTQLTYDRQEFHPKLQLLVYPMLDDRTALRADLEPAAHFVWTHTSNKFAWQAYLQKAYNTEGVSPYAAPARRIMLTGLPPAWIGIGTLDLFYKEAATYAQRLQDSSIECELTVVAGAFHGFDRATPQPPVVKNFFAAQINALHKYL